MANPERPIRNGTRVINRLFVAPCPFSPRIYSVGKAGVQSSRVEFGLWVPAFAGMTVTSRYRTNYFEPASESSPELRYDVIREAAEPDAALREFSESPYFLESAFGAPADPAHWDRGALERGAPA